MISQFFYLFLVILVASFAPEKMAQAPYTQSLSLGLTVVSFLFCIGCIALQNQLLKSYSRHIEGRLLLFSHLYFFLFALFSFFYLATQTFFPIFATYESIFSLLVIILYGIVLTIHYITASKKKGKKRNLFAIRQVLLIAPFLIPYFILTFSIDFFEKGLGFENETSSSLLAGVILLCSLLFLPWLIQLLWGCKPLEDRALNNQLEDICKRAKFIHGGIKTWTVLNHAITAAIIGILPRYRYVMFTKRLIDVLAPEQIEAVLAHEIGHSKRKHLLIYPFILLGMIVSVLLLFSLLGESLKQWTLSVPFIATAHPLVKDLFLFFPYLISMAMYFRFVFGYFSRLFERQADLYAYDVAIPPQNMISALDHIAVASGNIHDIPSWHHFGIAERIHFLQTTIDHPEAIDRHHRKVKVSVLLYFIFLFAVLILLWTR